MSRLLVVMGSGETAPTMVKPHRAVFTRVTGAAALLDTPYGFQSNADDISARAVRYFAESVGQPVSVVSWRQPPADPATRERALAALRDAGWVFAGPGSPTYTLRQWQDTAIPELLADKLTRAGVILFASAAALTLGTHTVPVYEIYKAGIEPHWAPGLNLLEPALGFPAVLIPHYDNAEGGNHDTRYCYLGEGRLRALEAELPAGQLIIGVDEHTAVVFDLDAKTAAVSGNGSLTLRRAGVSAVFPTGSVLSFADLAAGPSTGAAVAPSPRSPDAPAPSAQPSLRGAADELDTRFAAALTAGDVDGCVAVMLELEQAIVDWSGDTETNDGADYPRSVLRGMVVRLGELARRGATDPAETVGPFVEALVELRGRARANRDYATSDTVRDRLAAAGIELRDTPAGTTWSLASPSPTTGV
jgi:cyanophycinase-like exopeptidase